MAKGLRLVLAGAPFDNGNRGVEALGRSVVDHLLGSGRVERLSVLDDGWGVRAESESLELAGVRNSRRLHRRESWTRITFDQRLGGLGNPVARRLREADAVLDISGGDSFAELYGPQRLATVCAPKEAALRAGSPLILLPQTYGPFRTDAGRARATRIVRAATLAYARDAASHGQLLDLAGADADPEILREGVDVAFALKPREPDAQTVDQVRSLGCDLLVGVNVSGLLRTRADHTRFGLAGDYLETMAALVQSLIAAGAFVLLVPHVHDDKDSENDATGIHSVQSALSATDRNRTWMLPTHLRAAELKWCIGQTSWFTGTRMHATIASLSSGVPTFAYAYSDKFRGVFGTCGMTDHVADARHTAGDAMVGQALASFGARDEVARSLKAQTSAVVARARSQLDEVLTVVTALAQS
ncbi:polysaccharide pyruvyl transferase family protein [Ornithinimicrobium ciconiae]|uniref:polysaccharide pyruvyl transferase family protein n=1 Tax=Ornithinimicrobium ciconiae TaxID=2594265 RepID=UPI0013FCF68B|nr:polysaccharide pyruvyl transferase family protein [Ornithinimicrobium ciconiae]